MMASLDREARQELELPELIADALIGETLAGNGKAVDTAALSIEAGDAIEGNGAAVTSLKRRAFEGLRTVLPSGNSVRRPFHWPLEFPEVFGLSTSGFDAIVGNPPFITGKRISTTLGNSYQKYLKEFRSRTAKAQLIYVSFSFGERFSFEK